MGNVIQYAACSPEDEQEVNVIVNGEESEFFELPENGIAVLEDLAVVATFNNYEPGEESDLKPDTVYQLVVKASTSIETDVELPDEEDVEVEGEEGDGDDDEDDDENS